MKYFNVILNLSPTQLFLFLFHYVHTSSSSPILSSCVLIILFIYIPAACCLYLFFPSFLFPSPVFLEVKD